MAKVSRSRGEWRALVRAFEGSRSGAERFAREHDVSVATLKWWRSQLRDGVGFVEVVVDHEAAKPQPFVFVLQVGHQVIVPPGFDGVELRRLVDVLC